MFLSWIFYYWQMLPPTLRRRLGGDSSALLLCEICRACFRARLSRTDLAGRFFQNFGDLARSDAADHDGAAYGISWAPLALGGSWHQISSCLQHEGSKQGLVIQPRT